MRVAEIRMCYRECKNTNSYTQYTDGTLKLILHQVSYGNLEIMEYHFHINANYQNTCMVSEYPVLDPLRINFTFISIFHILMSEGSLSSNFLLRHSDTSSE